MLWTPRSGVAVSILLPGALRGCASIAPLADDGAWMSRIDGAVPKLPVIESHADRIMSRPAVARAKARDAELAAAQG